MSNNKQSSVEWLYQEFERIDKEFYVGSHEYNYAKNLAFKISKAMHKEEVEQFASRCVIQHLKGNPKLINEYYNETFGGNNES